MITQQLIQILIALDQLLNTVVGLVLVVIKKQASNIGWADETLSARAYRQRSIKHWYIAKQGINALFFWQKSHCKSSFMSELKRRQLPPEYRDEQNTVS